MSDATRAIPAFLFFYLQLPNFRVKIRHHGRRDWIGIAIVMCQIMAMTLHDLAGAVLFLVIGSAATVIAWADLKRNIANMEV